MRLDRNFVKSALPEATFDGIAEPFFEKFVIDSREVTAGATFVARKGSAVDGHDFVSDAVARGATGLIIDQSRRAVLSTIPSAQLKKLSIALVPSAEEALVRLAKSWRAQFSIPVVGITGSIGKTSTKEMLAEMVRVSGKECLVSAGNYNTLLGLSMTLLQLEQKHQCAIVEMGISCPGEMEQLADLVRPTMGVITVIAHQHMDSLGSISAIAAEKRAIFKYFKPDNIGFINGDQPLLAATSYAHPVVRFGFKTINQIQMRRVAISGMKTTGILKLYGDRYPIVLRTPHQGRLLQALASAAPAYFLGVSNQCIVEVIQKFAAVPGRFEPLALRSGKGIVINDAYNANPESIKEALLAFGRFEAPGRKVAVLGDMLGLGASSPFWHRQIGRFLRKVPSVEHVIFVGSHMAVAQKTVPRYVQATTVATWQDVAPALETLFAEGECAILVKGSNGVGLGNVVKQLV